MLVARTGCQDVRERKREREGEGESSQPGGAACRQAGWWRRGGCVSGFISYCQPKLVFPEQKCQLVWHVFCLPVFLTHISTHTAGHLLVPPQGMQKHVHIHTHIPGSYSVWRLKPFPLNVAAQGVCVYTAETSEMERVHTFVFFTLAPSSSGYGLSRSSRRADLSADGVDFTLLPVKARGTISALYTITHQLCSYLQIGVHIALG